MNENKLHFVYLIPSDKTNTTEHALRDAALHMQAWCRWQMGNDKTFTPDFATYQTNHDERWYSEYDGGGIPYAERYWANAQTDARDFAGAGFYQEHDSWVIYVDAIIGQGQSSGGASVNGSGLCVLHGKDCASIRGQDTEWTLCRGIGGGLHEALHTLGLPHPPMNGGDFYKAVMGVGYTIYPDAILTANDKVTLDNHRFFSPVAASPKPHICPFDSRRPQPKPHPRPHPHVRPTMG